MSVKHIHICPHACTFVLTSSCTQTYFTEVWVNRDESSLDSEIFSDLPSYLRARVAQYITTDLVLQVGAACCVCAPVLALCAHLMCVQSACLASCILPCTHMCIPFSNRKLWSLSISLHTCFHTQTYALPQMHVLKDQEAGLQELIAQHLHHTHASQTCAHTFSHTCSPQMHVLKDQEAGLQELIAQHLRPVDVTPGHDVCRQGEEGDRLWICAEGDLLALQVCACAF